MLFAPLPSPTSPPSGGVHSHFSHGMVALGCSDALENDLTACSTDGIWCEAWSILDNAVMHANLNFESQNKSIKIWSFRCVVVLQASGAVNASCPRLGAQICLVLHRSPRVGWKSRSWSFVAFTLSNLRKVQVLRIGPRWVFAILDLTRSVCERYPP